MQRPTYYITFEDCDEDGNVYGKWEYKTKNLISKLTKLLKIQWGNYIRITKNGTDVIVDNRVFEQKVIDELKTK